MMELDEIAAQQLTLAIFNDVRAYYARMPTHRARVFEVLTALAFVAAKTLQATDADADECGAGLPTVSIDKKRTSPPRRSKGTHEGFHYPARNSRDAIVRVDPHGSR